MACGHRALYEVDFAFCGKRQTIPPVAMVCASGKHWPVKIFLRQLFTEMGVIPPMFSFAKENQKTRRRTVRSSGDLSFEGKGHQSERWPLRCGRSGLYVLLRHSQRLRRRPARLHSQARAGLAASVFYHKTPPQSGQTGQSSGTPVELGPADWQQILTEFIQTNFVSDRMCADIAIHDPSLLCHNSHAHILLTVRPLDEHGKWQYKTEKEYLCVRNGEERGFTSAEFKTAQAEG
jgi:hypothetical protein